MLRYKLYSTSGAWWVQEQANVFASEISKTKGRGDVFVDVVKFVPKTVKFDKEKQIDWTWFRETFSKEDYDGVIFHFTPYYRNKWRLNKAVNGERNKDNLDYPEFYICAEKSVMADGYPEWVTDFLRLLFHEQAHFDEDLDDMFGNILTQDSVHDVDYKLKQIHRYHLLVDYRGMALKQEVNRLVNTVMKLVKKYI